MEEKLGKFWKKIDKKGFANTRKQIFKLNLI